MYFNKSMKERLVLAIMPKVMDAYLKLPEDDPRHLLSIMAVGFKNKEHYNVEIDGKSKPISGGELIALDTIELVDSMIHVMEHEENYFPEKKAWYRP